MLGRACEQGGEAGRLDADIFLVFSADVGDGFVVECFAESVGVVAVVGVEGVGEGVALGLHASEFDIMGYIRSHHIANECIYANRQQD